MLARISRSGRWVGQHLRRKEDLRLVRGLGLFLDDHRAPGMLHVGFARSAYAHARIRRIDVSAARALPGVRTVLTGAELFTGDAMLAPLAAFVHKISWAKVLNLWIWVYIGNLIGSIFYAYIMANGPFVSWNAAGLATVNAFGLRAVNIGIAKVSYVGMAGMWAAFLKGIGCNWLVNLAILLGICADDAVGKFFGIWFPIMAFVSTGFEHCVANMYFIPAGIMTAGYLNAEQVATITAEKLATLNWVTMWTNNIIVVTIGNIVGGLIFVGVLYWIAFKKEIEALE